MRTWALSALGNGEPDIKRERTELAANEVDESKELAAIYVKRGLDSTLANQVAAQLMAKDALAAHARDEPGISETISARPVQTALTSAATFAVGAALPLLVVMVAPATSLVPLVAAASLLLILGALAAYAGGARVGIGIVRVTFWGALAMAITTGIGALFGTLCKVSYRIIGPGSLLQATGLVTDTSVVVVSQTPKQTRPTILTALTKPNPRTASGAA